MQKNGHKTEGEGEITKKGDKAAAQDLRTFDPVAQSVVCLVNCTPTWMSIKQPSI